jgi:hypothetical protein
MKEQKIAVITHSMKGFEAHVRQVYDSLPTDKSMVVSPTHRFITVEHPVGVGRKYLPVQSMGDLEGVIFDEVEKTRDFFLFADGHELYHAAIMRIHSS